MWGSLDLDNKGESLMRKVSIIGVGNVGSTLAYTLLSKNLVDELVLINRSKDAVEACILDLKHSLAFEKDIKLVNGNYEDVRGSDIVVVAAGFPILKARAKSRNVNKRLDLLRFNYPIIEEIAHKIKIFSPNSIVITVTNPVDILNYFVHRVTGIPRSKVIGAGCQLDSARFTTLVKEEFGVTNKAYVLGIHGDFPVPLFSRLSSNGKKVEISNEEKRSMLLKLNNSYLNIVKERKATTYGPVHNIALLIDAILNDKKKLMICSTTLLGEYSICDVSLSVPVIIGRSGVESIEIWPISNEEREALIQSSVILKDKIKSAEEGLPSPHIKEK